MGNFLFLNLPLYPSLVLLSNNFLLGNKTIFGSIILKKKKFPIIYLDILFQIGKLLCNCLKLLR